MNVGSVGIRANPLWSVVFMISGIFVTGVIATFIELDVRNPQVAAIVIVVGSLLGYVANRAVSSGLNR